LQAIPTLGAADCEFFTIDADAYLAIANTRDDTGYRVNSRIYRWNGTQFGEFQLLPTVGAEDCEFFMLHGQPWLAVANAYDGSTEEVDSRLYRWNGRRFVEFASIPTRGAKDLAFFTMGDGSYLAAAGATSTIYQYHDPVATGPSNVLPPPPVVRRLEP
jgi:hypothetical protein